jgi:hypothetical protein
VGHALGESETPCLLIALSFLKGRRPWFTCKSNNALATVPSLSGMVGHFRKPHFRAQHERFGFLTARNHVSSDFWASRLLTSQWPNSTGAHRISEATRFSISPATASTSGASRKAERNFIHLAHFSQSKTWVRSPT